MQAIFTTEGLTVPEDEMRSEAESVIAEAKEAKQELDEERLMEQIYETLKVTILKTLRQYQHLRETLNSSGLVLKLPFRFTLDL